VERKEEEEEEEEGSRERTNRANKEIKSNR
jgi:hypothetical protein